MKPRTVHQLIDLSGRTALITGGSRGLGLQMAHALGEAGARIVISARKENELKEAEAELAAAGINASSITADCAREADVMALADAALERLAMSISWSTMPAPPGARLRKIFQSRHGTR